MEDLISRQMALDCVTYDVEHTIECLKALPSATPSTAQTTETTAPTTDGWIPVEKRLPAVRCCRCLVTRADGRGGTTVEEALFLFGGWYSHEWIDDGRNRKYNISASVIAWRPFPEPYRGGDE